MKTIIILSIILLNGCTMAHYKSPTTTAWAISFMQTRTLSFDEDSSKSIKLNYSSAGDAASINAASAGIATGVAAGIDAYKKAYGIP